MTAFSGQRSDQSVLTCPKCGYPVSEEMIICPSCKVSLTNNETVITGQGHNEMKKTIVAGEDCPEACGEEKASVTTGFPKQTVVSQCSDENDACPSKNTGKSMLKQTVMDFCLDQDNTESKSAIEESVGNDTEVDDEPEPIPSEIEPQQPEWKYLFECMDTEEHDQLVLVSKSEMFFSKDEIILISGLRFKFKIENNQ